MENSSTPGTQANGDNEHRWRLKIVAKDSRFWLAILFIVGLVIWFCFTYTNEPEFELTSFASGVLKEIGKGIVLFVIVSLGVKYIVTKRVKDVQDQWSKALRDDLSKRIDDLVTHNRILETTKLAGIEEIYHSRRQARKGISPDFYKSRAVKIKIVGISLKDLLHSNKPDELLADTFISKFLDYLGSSKVEEIDIKILLLDPNSRGAFLRESDEVHGDQNSKLKLYERINDCIDNLRSLINDNFSKEGKGKNCKIEVKLYRSAPILFMFWNPDFALVQPYYLTGKVDLDKNIMLTKYTNRGSEARCLHNMLEMHFDYLWKYESTIPVREYKLEHSIGTDLALRKMAIPNIYIPSKYKGKITQRDNHCNPIHRMRYLIQNTEEILYIKLVSMRLFLGRDGYLREELIKSIEKISDVRLLLINPDSEQAMMRSYCEYLLSQGEGGSPTNYQDFCTNQKLRTDQTLFKDTTASIENAKDLLQKFKEKKIYHEGQRAIDLNLKPFRNFQVGLYSSAPDSAFIMTDKSVLYEPLHVGSIDPVNADNNDPSKILSREMPMLEFKNTGGVYDTYDVIKKNFENVFEYFTESV